MVKKKERASRQSPKKDARKKKDDVVIHTGLPPKVEGQLRCHCCLSVSQVKWTCPSPPDVTHVRVRWWGEEGEGAIFRPYDARKGNFAMAKTLARYPIKSGPKQFSAYLTDMSSLLIEVLSGGMMVPVGYAEVTDLGKLSSSSPVKGWYPVMSPNDDKLAELEVSLHLETVTDSYDSLGDSIPTTDLSMDANGVNDSMYPQRIQHKAPYAIPPRIPTDDPFISPVSNQNGSVPNGYANTAADLRKQLNYSFHDNRQHSHPQPVESGSTVEVTANGDIVTSDLDQNHLNFISHPTPNHSAISVQSSKSSRKQKASVREPPPQAAPRGAEGPEVGDLLSILLQKGDKLRKEMIISSVEDNVTNSKEITSASYKNGHENGENNMSRMSESRRSTGSFFKELLQSEKAHQNGHVDVSQFEENAIDLIMGGSGLDDYQMLNLGAGSPGSISDDQDLVSDPGDPIHSETLLKELFYKNPDSEVSELSEFSDEDVKYQKVESRLRTASPAPSMEDPDNVRPPSRRSSVSSITLPLPMTETPEKPKKKSEKPKTPKRKGRVKLRRKGSKKRRKGSRSLSRSASEFSDDSFNTSRSEMSQVSFDMPASDLDEPEQEMAPRRGKKKVDGLSIERLTLLGRVHVARVVIDQLKLVGFEQNTTPSKKKPGIKSVGKPPKPSPKVKKAATYFIEYQFPVVATSRDKHAPNAMATEVTRVASKNIKDGVVTFNHRSVFPIMFDGTAVDNWWKSALIFKLFARSTGQKVPNLVGSCGIPLKSILKSDSFHLDSSLDIQENSISRPGSASRRGGSDVEGFYGKLKVSVELASDSKDFSSALAKTKLAEMSGKAKIVPIPKPPPPKPPVSQEPSAVNTQDQVLHFNQLRKQTESEMKENIVREVEAFLQRNSQASSTTSSQQKNYGQGLLQIPVSYDPSNELPEVLTLHTLLLIPEGRNITLNGIPCLTSLKRHPVFPPKPHSMASDPSSRSMNSRNTYLVCRMFWCDDAVHSDVCWNDPQPQYNFSQIAPVLVSQSLLERMRNNFMVVEIWDKKTNAENDKLIGIVKLSLHQFYMSFRDRKISSALLKSQYPVIAVDNYLPIVDPLTGSQYGQLKVLLAMGSAEQVSALQRMKMESAAGLQVLRPSHQLDGNLETSQEGASRNQFGTSVLVEHIFEVVIEGIRGLSMFDNMMWGEADCFIQYHFPTQSQTEVPGAPIVRHSVPKMKTFRSATTLCIPDPTFNDITRHRLCLPQGSPVQRELLTACAGSGSSGGVPFEVWCRYYHPNVRDQCIAKTSLPLAKLCAMVTMQKRNEPAVQTFTLPINSVTGDGQEEDPEQKAKQKDCGLLTLTIHYKTHIAHNESSTAAHRNIGQSQVCLTVGILKACGLKAAAESLAYTDSGMQYPAEVGVNTYIKVQLSFLDKSEERITRTVARSFAPEFSHTMDFPCNLIWTEADNEALSLAEILERGQLHLQVWHQVPGLASDIDRQMMLEDTTRDKKLGDVLLGTCEVPLSTVLTHRTGISGWFPITVSPNVSSEDNMDASGYHGNYLHRVVGGVELEVKFAHHNDREKVIHAGRNVGWSPVDLQVEDEEEWMSDDESSDRFYHITICVDQANFPLANALATGQDTLEKGARCYVRYKLYDKAAVLSKVTKMADSDGILTSELGHKHTLNIPASSPFRWYLREEKLEVQVWVSYSYNQSQRPQHRDKLIGTAYINLETLADTRRTQHRVSGLYPLFKAGGANLGGGFIQAHVTLKPMFGIPRQRENEANMSDIHDTDYDPNDSFHQLSGNTKRSKPISKHARVQEEDEEVVPSFSVLISVERAMHLPRVSENSRSGEHLPNTYVSYQTAESADPTFTDVFPNSDNPVWDHQNETRLSTELLYQENRNLVFKVWHKPSSCGKTPDKCSDRVLGFVSVDLTPLASGLQQMCGWYNIMDFNGQCQGQIKVNIIPQECLRQYNQETNSPNQPTSLPVRSESSIHHLPAWIHEQPMSFPLSDRPFTSSLPQFDSSPLTDVGQPQVLQQQLVENIRNFLDQQQATLDSKPDFSSVNTHREPSIHWVPSVPENKYEETNDSSRSFLFGSLRKQMQDLDQITSRLKQKLTPVYSLPQHLSSEPEAPVSCRSTGHATLTSTHSGLSTISTLHLQHSQRDSSRTQESDLLLTASNEAESSRTGVDSGVLSVTQSSEKYQDQEALDSQRSDGLDAFRLRSLTHEFNKDSPRDQNSDTGIHCPYKLREDDSSSNSNVGNTPRDSHSKSSTPRGSTPRDPYSVSNGSKMSDPSSLGFQYQGDMSSRSHISAKSSYQDGGGKSPVDVAFGLANEKNSNVNFNSNEKKMESKDMSVIEENADESGGEGDEKYYHRYRDILDEQDSEGSEVESEADIVVPRTLNDVSGKFGGIPGHEAHSNAGPRESPREFHQSDHTMPFEVGSSRSGSKSNSGSKKTSEAELSDLEELHRENLQDSRCEKHQFYVEKDSWFSDEEGDLHRSGYDPSFTQRSTRIVSLEVDVEENLQEIEIVEKDSWFSSDQSKSNLESSNPPNENDNSEMNSYVRHSKHLLSKVKLDTISSVGSREYDSFYIEERDLLNNVELDSVTSGTNTQKGESVYNSTASFHVRKSSDLENYHEERMTHDCVPKSPKEIYNHVVSELEEFFEHSRSESVQGHFADDSEEEEEGDNFHRLGEAENGSSDEEEVDIEVQQTNHGKGKDTNQQIPNFFLPVEHLQESMKVLHLATKAQPGNDSSEVKIMDPQCREEKSQAAAEMKNKLSQNVAQSRFANGPTKSRQLPTAEEAKRIAKIFSSKHSK
ncbi:C2 domain-containing protein 3-like [Crassostrea angulata]|uniref:C2 domain-containing protein 3-like n=1 Tax=Magallana angulata TaxID=2784310 RepID=UPI0022B1DA9D|nr:C2 domain-containing protein 3-like [Crassostrea angulata]